MKRNIILVLSLVLLFGCYPAQQASLQPTLNVMPSSLGHNKTIGVRVVDERSSKSLGRRDFGSEITANQDVVALVEKEVFNGLKKKGFNPISYSKEHSIRLTIEIRLLEYSTTTGFVTSSYITKGAIKAIGINKDKIYERIYRSEKEKGRIIIPSAFDNEQLINAVFSDVLAKLLNDYELFSFLAKE